MSDVKQYPDLPVHPTLTWSDGSPVKALGFGKRGQVIWPVAGGSQMPPEPLPTPPPGPAPAPAPAPAPPAPAPPAPPNDEYASLRNAIESERRLHRQEETARKAAEAELAALKALVAAPPAPAPAAVAPASPPPPAPPSTEWQAAIAAAVAAGQQQADVANQQRLATTAATAIRAKAREMALGLGLKADMPADGQPDRIDRFLGLADLGVQVQLDGTFDDAELLKRVQTAADTNPEFFGAAGPFRAVPGSGQGATPPPPTDLTAATQAALSRMTSSTGLKNKST